MNLEERIKRYRAIETYRDRPLVVYATSTRPNVSGMMAGDAIRELIDQIDSIDDGDSIDVLIHSTGGDGLTAWKLMSLLRERFANVSVLVPNMAFSAATIFALGADEIVMHPHASLGPIDPQIKAKQPDGTVRLYAYEDVGAFIEYLFDDARASDMSQVAVILDKLFAIADPLVVGGAKRASELSTDMAKRLLSMHLDPESDKERIERIAEDLNKSFFSHSSAISRSRARELQLKIAEDDSELERLLWDAFLAIESHMELRSAFNPLHIFMADAQAAASLQMAPALQLPADTPQDIALQIWNQTAQAALQKAAGSYTSPSYEQVNAIMESVRVASEFRIRGEIDARRVGLNVEVSCTDRSSGWQAVEIDEVADPAPSTESESDQPVPA